VNDKTARLVSEPPGNEAPAAAATDEANPIRLHDVMRLAEQKLWTEFEESSAAFTHPGMKGTGRENAITRFLSNRLPARFGVGRGQVFDRDGGHSGQLDVVIYDQLNAAPLYTDEDNPLLPAEALLAVIEVKTTLTRAETAKALNGAGKVARLKPGGKRFAPPRHRGEASSASPRCLFNIFAFDTDLSETDWLAKEWQRVNEVAKENHVQVAQIDRLVVLRRGLIIPRDCVGISSAGEQRILGDWYLHLTNFLAREAARRSSFDWEEYGHEDAMSGWIRLEGWTPAKKTPAKKQPPALKPRPGNRKPETRRDGGRRTST